MRKRERERACRDRERERQRARQRERESLLLVGTALGRGLLRRTTTRDTARSALAVGRVHREVDVLLRVGAHQEGRHVHHLLAHADVALADEHAGVVDRLGEVLLEHLRLQSALHEDLQ